MREKYLYKIIELDLGSKDSAELNTQTKGGKIIWVEKKEHRTMTEKGYKLLVEYTTTQ